MAIPKIVRLTRVGNTLCVPICKEIRKIMALERGDLVAITPSAYGFLRMRKIVIDEKKQQIKY